VLKLRPTEAHFSAYKMVFCNKNCNVQLDKAQDKMKKIAIIVFVLVVNMGFSQVCIGCGNSRFSVGGSYQKEGIGANVMFDYGISNFFSWGISGSYVLVTPTPLVLDNEKIDNDQLLLEKGDLNFRFNSHIGSVIASNNDVDVYAGVNIGFRNIGSQVGVRYLVTDSFGFYAEAGTPLYKHNAFVKVGDANYYDFYNQTVVSLGIVFGN
jgi:hypothetical protein